MVNCTQCGSERIGVCLALTVDGVTLFQDENGVWNEFTDPDEKPTLEFWCENCEHSWQMEGTLDDVRNGVFDTD